MIYETSAFIFAVLTGYVAVRYEGRIISRIAVFMLLTAAGGSLAGSLMSEAGDVIEYSSVISLIALLVGHVGSEMLFSRWLDTKKPSDGAPSDIKDTNDLLLQLASNKDLNIETELSLKVK